MSMCGKPAVYFGYLNLTTYYGMSGRPYGPSYQVAADLISAPFCEKCTRTRDNWHRVFVSKRRAFSFEKCMASTAPGPVNRPPEAL